VPRRDVEPRKAVPQSGIRERAAELVRLNDALGSAYAAWDGSPERDAAWRDAADALQQAVSAFYEPLTGLPRRIRDGDRTAMDDAVRFLEADPWCFRSGYVKEELMTALANAKLPEDLRGRLQAVVLRRLTHREPRLLRPTGRLAANVWDDALARQVTELAATGGGEEREDAAAVLQAVAQKERTVAGQRATS
jgi:hypothetical protein